MKRIILSLVALFAGGIAAFSQPAGTASIPASTTPPQFKPSTPNPHALTPDEMKELNLARQKAMQANPDLQKSNQELSQKMRDFEHKLNQAILAADPNLAPVVNRIESSTTMRPPMSPAPAAAAPAVPPAPAHP